jgi:hypothetical protein
MGIAAYLVGSDRDMAWYQSASVRYVIASVTAERLERREARPGLNIAIVKNDRARCKENHWSTP